jgi:DNA-binding protein HU-beta
MNKTDLIEVVAKEADLKKKDAEIAVSAVIAAIENALVAGDKVSLVGFGTFEVKATAAKTGINPQTKEKIQIPAKKAVKFSVGKALKDKVNA